LKLTFLGTGTSQGIPVINCTCPVCNSDNVKDKRLRTSAWIQTETNSLVIDIGPDFRQQVLFNKLSRVDALLLTHEHADHTAGLDDIRPINFSMKMKIPLYAERRVILDLTQRFYYVFGDSDYPGLPQLDLREVEINTPFKINDDLIHPIRISHGMLDIIGFKIGELVYITDAKSISDEVIEQIKNCKILVLNALRHKEHHSHLNLSQAIQYIHKIKPEKAYLTHISHQLGLHADVERTLDSNIHLAYDGLELQI
jgi:phosphoribosyl 1,2-cyclic phosphate phosphodiesterase